DDAGARCQIHLQRLAWLVLGYDADAADVRAILADLHGPCAEALRDDAVLADGELALLERFADLQAVTSPRSGDDEAGDGAGSPAERFHAWLRSLDARAEGLSDAEVRRLERALAHYGVDGLERTAALEAAAHRLFLAEQRSSTARAAIVAILERRLAQAGRVPVRDAEAERRVLTRLAGAADPRDPVLADLARETRWVALDEPVIAAAQDRAYAEMEDVLAAIAADPDGPEREELLRRLVACPRPLATLLSERMSAAHPPLRRVLLEAMTRRYYRMRSLDGFHEQDGFLMATYSFEGRIRHLCTRFVELGQLGAAARAFADHARRLPDGLEASADFYAEVRGDPGDRAALAAQLLGALAGVELPAAVHRIVVAVAVPARGRGMGAVDLFTFRRTDDGLVEDEVLRGLHPMMAHRLNLWRMANFALERLPSAEDVYLFRGVARENPKDERLFAVAEVRDLTAVRDEHGRLMALPELERMLTEALEAMRAHQAHVAPSRRLYWNRVLMHVWPVSELSRADIERLAARVGPQTAGLGLEMVLLKGRLREDGVVRDRVMRFFSPAGSGAVVEIDDPPTRPLQPMDEGTRRIISARRRGTPHPAEVVKLLGGTFTEHDLDASGRLAPVDRPPAFNDAAIVVGLVTNPSDRYPEGMLRVALLGDPTKALGSLAEPECRRINAALDLAEELGVPLEWFAISAGAKIAMDSGTENMDWIAAVLRRIIEFTQQGGEINIVVTGINVGAQPYWNAEATMLMHTRGILVMAP
ncbi:MAG TPA: hypothetical protein VLB47_00290, partial [Solirubrobacteraceae bacterium]|nr:hypothetical protein [Solirubrobacteraceae bacterium]